MRIAMISEHASPLATLGGVDSGGQNVHVAALARALAGRGHQITVYTRRDSSTPAERERLCPGVTVEHLTGGPPEAMSKDDLPAVLPEMAADLLHRLPRSAPDVIHAHYWMSGWLALQAKAALDLPVVQTFHALGVVKRRHQGDADSSPSGRIETETALAHSATRLTAACTDELRELIGLGATRDRVEVVPCGVDVTRFQPGDPVRRSGRRRVAVVSRLVARKGIDDVIRALPILTDVELVIVGGPEHRALASDAEARRLMTIAEGLGVRDRVDFRGPMPHAQLPELLRSVDVVACVPHYEPFGLVPLEAMACGVPVVGSAVGGLLDTVRDGVTGLLVPPRRPDAVAAAIRRVLDDEMLRATCRRAGPRRAGRYDWPRIAAATERTYLRAALSGAARTPRREEGVG